MIDSCANLSIDISQSNSPVCIRCKQDDTGRVLRISLSDCGYPYQITEDCYAAFSAVKADGKIVYNPCQIVDGVIIYEFTKQTCACPGKMVAEIKLYGSDNKLLTSASFLIFVDKTVFQDGNPVVSEDEVTTLTRLISETLSVKQEIEEGIASGAFIGPPGPVGPKGADGTVSFDELSDAQRESLRGETGPKGEPGDNGEPGSPGIYYGAVQPTQDSHPVWIDPEGEPWYQFTQEEIDQIAQQAAEILRPEVNQIKNDKLDKPATPPDAAGKVLRVLAVNEDGTFTCEWADAPSGGGAVDDVQIDGTSVVSDGIASIPIADINKIGLVKLGQRFYTGLSGDNGHLSIWPASEVAISGRRTNNTNLPIVHSTYDFAVKCAMTDGKGDMWTDAERIAALLRMGCTVDDNGFVKWTAREVAG